MQEKRSTSAVSARLMNVMFWVLVPVVAFLPVHLIARAYTWLIKGDLSFHVFDEYLKWVLSGQLSFHDFDQSVLDWAFFCHTIGLIGTLLIIAIVAVICYILKGSSSQKDQAPESSEDSDGRDTSNICTCEKSRTVTSRTTYGRV